MIPELLRRRYTWLKQHSARDETPGVAMEIMAEDRVGLMADIAAMVARYGWNLNYIQSWIEHHGLTHILIQVDEAQERRDQLVAEVGAIRSVKSVVVRPTYSSTYGKRVIVLGGGAQVAQVAAGAIAEADRHNIRGETISVDTIAIVGESQIAEAVRAVGRLHRAGILVLAGALMGGDITEAVRELREQYGIPVIALRMAGSVPRVTDLIVTDPTAAGVMAVMAISHVGRFDLLKLHGRTY